MSYVHLDPRCGARSISNPAKELGYLLLADLALGDGQGKLNQSLFITVRVNAVERKKNECATGAGALVPVHERMVLDDVVQVRRSHLEQILMEELASKGCLRHGDRRVQKADLAHSLGASVVFDQTKVRP